MILLLTASQRAQECATAVQVATGQPTDFASTLSEALGLLRSKEYAAVILDQCTLEADPEHGDLLLQHLRTATPIPVNCALAGIERIVREVRAALARREIEVCNARNSAESALRTELREPLTAMLLNCDILLEMPGLSQSAREKLEIVQEMAHRLADRLEVHDITIAQT
jgi:hypothetical protein